jgi:hypothetical protein
MGKHFQEHHFGLIHSWKEMVNGKLLDQVVVQIKFGKIKRDL